MSAPATADGGRWARVPGWLRPRDHEQPGTGQLRLVETTLLILVGIILAVATVNDLSRQAGVNRRLEADLHTWRHYTGHDFHNISIDQQLLGEATGREVVCGNTRAAAPKSTTQLCLMIWGPTVDGRRTVQGGWYLPPYVEDEKADRYGCFGVEAQGLCTR